MNSNPGRGLIVSAPASGAGKTLVTLGLLAALRARGVPVRGAKSGPDYIDPRFHEAACGAPCLNLDAWAMTPERIRARSAGAGVLLIEGAMGLFDGAPPDGRGASADLARQLALPVVLIVDARSMAHSVVPLVQGFAHHDPAVHIAGVILNRVGSPRHAGLLRRALEGAGVTVLGALPRAPALTTPGRHLGLIQAAEHPDLTGFIARAADLIAETVDLDRLLAEAAPLPTDTTPVTPPSPPSPPAQRIAVARDAAFGFAYPHMLEDWRRAGAEILPFSPLADQPPPLADLIFLPGGYPELHAGQIAAAQRFLTGLRSAARAGTMIYGECGGYMVLGQGLIDADGTRHAMVGLLDLETSFAQRRLHLGYRHLHADTGPFAGTWRGHEFHYATTLQARGTPLFHARDAEDTPLPPMGLRAGRVSGSFAHLIDIA